MNTPWTPDDVLERLHGEQFFADWLVAQGTQADSTAGEGNEAKTRREPEGLNEPRTGEREDREPSQETWPQFKTRLAMSAALGQEAGRRAMFDAAAGYPQVLAALRNCASDLHRSVWLYVHRRDLFERACALDLMQAQGYTAMQYWVGAGWPRRDRAAMDALGESVGALYRRLYGRGHRYEVRVAKPSQSPHSNFNVISIVVDIDDEAAAIQAVPCEAWPVGSGAQIRYGSSRLQALLDFAPAAGVLRVLLRGKLQCHLEVMRAFSQHMLDRDVRGTPILAELDLQVFLQRLESPDLVRDGFASSRVVSLELRRDDASTAMTWCLNGSREHSEGASTETSREMIARELGLDPLLPGWQVCSATLALRLLDGEHEIEISLRRNGSCDLYRFDALVQARIEGYLIDLGVIEPHQALHGGSAVGNMSGVALQRPEASKLQP